MEETFTVSNCNYRPRYPTCTHVELVESCYCDLPLEEAGMQLPVLVNYLRSGTISSRTALPFSSINTRARIPVGMSGVQQQLTTVQCSNCEHLACRAQTVLCIVRVATLNMSLFESSFESSWSCCSTSS